MPNITLDISSYLPKLAIILEPVQEDWEQLGLQLNIDESVLTDIRNKGDSTEQINCLLEEWALKEGILIQLEEALLRIGKKEVIPGMLYMTVNFSCDLSVEQDIISIIIFYYQIYMLYKRRRVLLLTLVNRSLPNPMINQVIYILYIIVIYKPVFSKGDTKKYIVKCTYHIV